MSRLLIVLALILPMFACQANAGNGVFMIESVTPGKGDNVAPDFTWKEGGATKTFSQVTKGKVVVLNLWATWCGPCRKEIPDLIELSKSRPDVVVIGVSEDDDKKYSSVVSYVEKNGISYVNLMDSMKKLAEAFGGIAAIPTTFVIKDGKIYQKIVGSRSKMQFESAVDAVK